MGWWKADPLPSSPTTFPQSTISLPPPQPSTTSTASPSECPVDPKTRSIWLQQAQKQQSSSSLPPSHPAISNASNTFTTTPSAECSSDRIDQSPDPPTAHTPSLSHHLSHDRAISSIPRATIQPTSPKSTPANSESDTGAHHSGNWIYPSESQFFHAVLRKHDPAALAQSAIPSNPSSSSPTDSLAATMPTIIPLHNAVNERAWSLIKTWEGNTSAVCGGPKLASFKGLGAGALSPTARLNSLIGYTAPFDRHDWVVERCDGSRVEYVIDFYQGKEDPSKGAGQLNFYLDVRPKINSVEGVRMRCERLIGWR